jgi:hypothetical protein
VDVGAAEAASQVRAGDVRAHESERSNGPSQTAPAAGGKEASRDGLILAFEINRIERELLHKQDPPRTRYDEVDSCARAIYSPHGGQCRTRCLALRCGVAM